MNSVQQLTSSANTGRVAPLLPPVTPRQQYWQGFDAYCDGATLQEMQSEPMRRGWQAALRAEAAAMSGYDCYMGW